MSRPVQPISVLALLVANWGSKVLGATSSNTIMVDILMLLSFHNVRRKMKCPGMTATRPTISATVAVTQIKHGRYFNFPRLESVYPIELKRSVRRSVGLIVRNSRGQSTLQAGLVGGRCWLCAGL